MTVRLDLVYNPASGNFRQKRLDELARELARERFDVRLVATDPSGVAIAPDAQLVCIHGGDGTARMVAKALGERLRTVPLAISPVGTINLLARELGYSANPRRFAAALAGAWRKGEAGWLASPIARSEETPVLSCLSIGPDSVAVAGLSAPLKARIGRLAYLVAGLRHLRRWPRDGVMVHALLANGAELSAKAEAVFLARGRYYAGPFNLSPRARLEAEGLELVLLEKAGRLRSLAFALAVMSGLCPERLGLATIHTVSEVRFEGGSLPVQVDGDAIGAGPLTIAMSGYCARFCV
jgi:diacylglycerol kinase family enzyme